MACLPPHRRFKAGTRVEVLFRDCEYYQYSQDYMTPLTACCLSLNNDYVVMTGEPTLAARGFASVEANENNGCPRVQSIRASKCVRWGRV